MSQQAQRPSTAADEEPVLAVDRLQTSFFTDRETIRAVDGISFEIGDGETVGVVGESGSGKSVTARSIMGLVDNPGRVVGGSVRFSDPTRVRPRRRRPRRPL